MWIVFVGEHLGNYNIAVRHLEDLKDLRFKHDLDYRYIIKNTATGDVYYDLTENQVKELRGDYL